MRNRFLTAIMAGALLLLGGCRRNESSPQSSDAKAEPARTVRVAVATEQPVERWLTATGILSARDQAAISVKVAGRVDEIPIDVGSVVKRGETLAQIQKRDYELKVQQSKAAVSAARARIGLELEGTNDIIEVKQSSIVKEAQAQLDEQRKNRDRIASLAEQKILSQSELETAEAAYQVTLTRYEDALQETNNRKAMLAQRRAELNIADQQLTDTLVRAPFDGVVQERKASPGEYLMEGAPLATLVRVDPIRLRLEVAEREAVAIRHGQRIRFRVDGDTNHFTGRIDRLSPAIAQDNRMLQIEADIANNDGRLRPGSFVRADIIVTENARAILVPKSAIVTFAGIEKVFVADNGKSAERRITSGTAHGDQIEIVKGLKAGEPVILDPGAMRAGQPIVLGKESNERTEIAPASG